LSILVNWWAVLDDGALHAFPRRPFGQPGHVQRALCGRVVAMWRIDRDGTGPRCYVCLQQVGPE